MSTEETNKDNWLHAMRRDPSPAFEARLRARLRADEPAPTQRPRWIRRALLTGAAVVVVAGLIAVPAVRASVAQFVSLFRVVHFVAVPVDASRFDRLRAENLDVGALIGENVQIVQDPGAPVSVTSVSEAASASGMTLALPQWLPDKTEVLETTVVGARAVRVTANTQRLQQVMDALGISDLTVPAGLDGHVVDVRVPPVVMIRYEHGTKRRTRLYQALTPQVMLPDNVNLPALGEIGLRILGLAPKEAKQFAAAMDWHTTLIVPVPPGAQSFRQVTINGHSGMVIQHQPPNQSPTTIVAWSTSDRVLALVTIEGTEDALNIAESVR